MRRWTWQLTGLTVAAVLVATAGFTQPRAEAQQAGSIKIMSPSGGSTVQGDSVDLTVDIQGVPVKAAAEGDPAAYHYHALVDVDPSSVLQAGQPIITGQANVIHTADRTLKVTGLAPGPHSITVVLTRTDHVPLTPNVQDRIAFVIAGAGQPAAGGGSVPSGLPRTGVGSAAPAPVTAAAAGLALFLAAGGLVLVRRAKAHRR